MKAGQVLKAWWQKLVAGGFNAPQDLYRSAAYEDVEFSPDPHRFFSTPADSDNWQAPKRLAVSPHFFTLKPHLVQSMRADWQHTDPRLMRWAALFVEYARKRNIPLYVHCAFRSKAEQDRVNHAGHSKAAFPNSAHNIGEAVDIVHGSYHWNLTKQEWQLLSVLGFRALDTLNATLKKADELHLTWGGDFKSLYDPAHWEITDFRSRRRLLSTGLPVQRMPRSILKL